jgi:molecular chaperone GrpE
MDARLMSEAKKTPADAANEAQIVPPETADSTAEANDEAVTDPMTVLQQELEAAQAKADENHNLYLRTAAELENVRKRAERETLAARKYGVEKLASELLAVRDSLELGLAAAADDNAEIKAVVEGMELTLKMLGDVMGKYGVTLVDPLGEVFNPDFHEAMTAQESTEHAPNTVMQVLQKGYRLQDRLLRPALVVVAKAPPSP